ncbi:MAG: Holliday junction branch migration protein RuvA [Ruminococcus sp.]|jgi:Holliday junction DNA helicase RuvA
MIVYVKGKTVGIGKDYAVVENGGIGYRIFMPGSMLEYLHTGMEVKIHTYYHVREDAVQLFGFLTEEDLNLFRLLIGVNGIGPKAALGILSALSSEEIQFAVLSEDVKVLAKAPGIGKKTAQKLILELKDKLDLEDIFEQKKAGAARNETPREQGSLFMDEAVQALTALGYSNTDALRSVRQVEDAENMDTEQILKAALKKLL